MDFNRLLTAGAHFVIILVENKQKKLIDKGWTCDLVPKALIVAHYFAAEQAHIQKLEADLERMTAQLNEMEEEQGGEEGAFAEMEKVTLGSVRARLKELAQEGGDLNQSEFQVITAYLQLFMHETERKRDLNEATQKLDEIAYRKYPALTEAEIKTLVVEDKWLAALAAAIQGEMERISQTVTQRVKELAERYASPLPPMSDRVAELERKVNRHLERMGFLWK